MQDSDYLAMGDKKSALDLLVDKAIERQRKLQHFEEGKKLTFQAFLKEALGYAKSTRKQIKQLGVDIEAKHGTHHTRTFIRRLAAALREPSYPRCPPDAPRCIRMYGSTEASVELQNLGATPAQAVALAVMQANKKYGEAAFGVIENWEKHETTTTQLREQIAALSEKMKVAVSGADLNISTSPDVLLPDERQRGLARVSFRRAPSLTMSDSDWPQRLIEDAAATIPAEAPRRPRMRLTKKAA